jgi:hypothetical protein
MAYNVKITFKGEDFSTDYETLDEVYNVVNSLGGYYGNDNLVAVSESPFIAIKFKDIEKLQVSGVTRAELRKFAVDKLAKLQAEKMAAYEAQAVQGNSLSSSQTLNSALYESSSARLI